MWLGRSRCWRTGWDRSLSSDFDLKNRYNGSASSLLVTLKNKHIRQSSDLNFVTLQFGDFLKAALVLEGKQLAT